MLRRASCWLGANALPRTRQFPALSRLASSGPRASPRAKYNPGKNDFRKPPSTPLNTAPTGEKWSKFWRMLVKGQQWVILLAKCSTIAILVSHIYFEYFYSYDMTYGISMLPTIYSFGENVIISKRYRRGRGIEVGDIVSFKHPLLEEEFAIKRVIGLGGDFVLMNTPEKSYAMIQVPEGHCWVVGDNLEYSRDSRAFGPLPLALIAGKVTAKLVPRWPFVIWLKPGLQDEPDSQDEPSSRDGEESDSSIN